MGDVDRAKRIAQWAMSDDAASRDDLLSALRDPSLLARLTAAIQVANKGVAPLPEPNTREIADALLCGRDATLDREYANATATDEDYRDLEQDLALALAALPAGSADYAILPLIAFWQSRRQFYEAALAALALAFGPSGARTAARLTPLQRSVLTALTENDPIWTCCGDTVPMLSARGLPESRERMLMLLSATADRAAAE